MIGSLYNSITFIKSSAAVDTSETIKVPREIRRSWRERLLSLPWSPWVKTKVIQVSTPKPAIFKIGNVIYYHPSLEETLKKSIEEWSK